MTTPASDTEYLREANAQRAHELRLAEIESTKQTNIEQLRYEHRGERLIWLGWVGVGLAIVTVILSIVGAIVWNVNHERQQRDRDAGRQAEIARECITAGNIWTNGSCLIARKAS